MHCTTSFEDTGWRAAGSTHEQLCCLLGLRLELRNLVSHVRDVLLQILLQYRAQTEINAPCSNRARAHVKVCPARRSYIASKCAQLACLQQRNNSANKCFTCAEISRSFACFATARSRALSSCAENRRHSFGTQIKVDINGVFLVVECQGVSVTKAQTIGVLGS